MSHSTLLRCLPAVGVLFLSACATTRAVDESELLDSGFLGTLTLEPDEKGIAGAIWSEKGLDLSGYTKVMVHPAEIWLAAENRDQVSDEDIAAMSKYGLDAAHASLGKHWDVVDKPGPDTLEIHWALTELVGASVAGSTFTKVIPQTKLLTGAGHLATSKTLFAGRAQIEAKAMDASGRPMIATRSARQGGQSITNAFSTWGEIKDSFDHFAGNAPKQLSRFGMKPTKSPIQK